MPPFFYRKFLVVPWASTIFENSTTEYRSYYVFGFRVALRSVHSAKVGVIY